VIADVEPDGLAQTRRPALSIVTVCFRNPEELAATLASTAGLDPELVERIVVDGSPDDSCAGVVAAAAMPVAAYIHESDDGIYDAMNKGIAVATGDTALMLNSGDRLHDARRLSVVLRNLRPKLATHLVYGDTIDDIDGALIRRPQTKVLSDAAVRRGELPSHQSVLVPLSYCRSNRYDAALSLSADTLFLRQAFARLPMLHVDEIIGVFAYGGRSNASGNLTDALRLFRQHVAARDLGPAEKAQALVHLLARWVVGCLLGREGHRRLQARRARTRAAVAR
jgi:putative colanic acid biosynthesis glycosyltransferase